jgi:hypothetical protein
LEDSWYFPPFFLERVLESSYWPPIGIAVTGSLIGLLFAAAFLSLTGKSWTFGLAFGVSFFFLFASWPQCIEGCSLLVYLALPPLLVGFFGSLSGLLSSLRSTLSGDSGPVVSEMVFVPAEMVCPTCGRRYPVGVTSFCLADDAELKLIRGGSSAPEGIGDLEPNAGHAVVEAGSELPDGPEQPQYYQPQDPPKKKMRPVVKLALIIVGLV